MAIEALKNLVARVQRGDPEKAARLAARLGLEEEPAAAPKPPVKIEDAPEPNPEYATEVRSSIKTFGKKKKKY